MAKPVFICHAREDAALAEQVCDFLERQGIPCWIAPRDVWLLTRKWLVIARRLCGCEDTPCCANGSRCAKMVCLGAAVYTRCEAQPTDSEVPA